ncbi:MAG: cupin domain-containing protein [Verrucomicrobia bacterium]|nr:cupin domain-containing protein [Verrucomicrobiota bacterium]
MNYLDNAQQIRADCNGLPWTPSKLAPGLSVKDVAVADGLEMQLVRLDPGATIPVHTHECPEFIYILEGELIIGGERLTEGSASVASIGSTHTDVHSDKGCIFLLVDKPI